MRNGTEQLLQPAMETSSPVLVVERLSKAFGTRTAINEVSFTLAAGGFTAVLGPSGAGKTTLFRCITGLARPDAGHVRFGDADVSALEVQDRRKIAVVFQQFNLVRRLTALDNVLAGRLGYVPLWRGVLRQFERADKLKAFESLERVGMLEQAHQRADTLSGGQQQRVAIARALAQEPRLIVADEPVASLDPSSAAGVLALLKDIARTDRVTVICSLHQVGYARTFADRIIGMAGGRLAMDAATATLDEAAFAALYATAPSEHSLASSGHGDPHAAGERTYPKA